MAHPETAWETLLLNQIDGAVRGGVDVVQIRERDVDAGVLAAFVRRCIALTEGTAARIVVNDRVDVAMAAGAGSVHLREDSIPTQSARQLLGDAGLIGRSVHSAQGASAVGPADYVIAGSVFETASKPGAPARLGLDGLRRVVKRAAGCPVWAVGGVTAPRLGEVTRAGASGMAAIGAFIPSCEPGQLSMTVQKMSEELRFCFDSPDRLP